MQQARVLEVQLSRQRARPRPRRRPSAERQRASAAGHEERQVAARVGSRARPQPRPRPGTGTAARPPCISWSRQAERRGPRAHAGARPCDDGATARSEGGATRRAAATAPGVAKWQRFTTPGRQGEEQRRQEAEAARAARRRAGPSTKTAAAPASAESSARRGAGGRPRRPRAGPRRASRSCSQTGGSHHVEGQRGVDERVGRERARRAAMRAAASAFSSGCQRAGRPQVMPGEVRGRGCSAATSERGAGPASSPTATSRLRGSRAGGRAGPWPSRRTSSRHLLALRLQLARAARRPRGRGWRPRGGRRSSRPSSPRPPWPPGCPGGICTVDSSASKPASGELARGTPMTGSVECAASDPRQVRGPARARDDHREARGPRPRARTRRPPPGCGARRARGCRRGRRSPRARARTRPWWAGRCRCPSGSRPTAWRRAHGAQRGAWRRARAFWPMSLR